MTPDEQKQALRPLITRIIELGYQIQLFCDSPISNATSSIALVMTEMDACDEMQLLLSSSEGKPKGWIFLVWGNDDMPHPINDYSLTLPSEVQVMIDSLPDELITLRNITSDEITHITPKAFTRFFDNRDPREWEQV